MRNKVKLQRGISIILILLVIEAALFLSVRWNPLLNDGLVFLFTIVFLAIGAAIFYHGGFVLWVCFQTFRGKRQ